MAGKHKVIYLEFLGKSKTCIITEDKTKYMPRTNVGADNCCHLRIKVGAQHNTPIFEPSSSSGGTLYINQGVYNLVYKEDTPWGTKPK